MSVGNLEQAQDAIASAVEDVDTIDGRLQESLEDMNTIAGKIHAVTEWLANFGATMAENVGENSQALQEIRGAAESAGEVIEAVGLFGIAIADAATTGAEAKTKLDEHLTQLGSLG